MLQGTMPVIEKSMPLVPLWNTIKFKTGPLTKDGGITTASAIHCDITMVHFKMVDCACGGMLCNAMYLFGSGVVNQTRCPCYTKRAGSSRIILALNIVAKSRSSGAKYTIKRVANREFQDVFLTNNSDIKGITADDLSGDINVISGVKTAIDEVFNKGNQNGGWNVVAWLKVGEIADGVESNQNPAYGQKQETVVSTAETLHVAHMSLNINRPSAVKQDEMAALKRDISRKLWDESPVFGLVHFS